MITERERAISERCNVAREALQKSEKGRRWLASRKREDARGIEMLAALYNRAMSDSFHEYASGAQGHL